MTQQTIYRCEGTCNGATFEAGHNCGAKDCNLFDVPLKKATQCAECAAKSAEDNTAHGCAHCSSN